MGVASSRNRLFNDNKRVAISMTPKAPFYDFYQLNSELYEHISPSGRQIFKCGPYFDIFRPILVIQLGV